MVNGRKNLFSYIGLSCQLPERETNNFVQFRFYITRPKTTALSSGGHPNCPFRCFDQGRGGMEIQKCYRHTQKWPHVVPDWSDQVLDQVNCAWQFLNNRTQHSQFLRCFSWLSGWMNAPPIFKSTCKVNWDDPKKWCKIGQAGFNLEHQINRPIYSIANRRRWVFCFCQFLWWWTQNQNWSSWIRWKYPKSV